MKCVKLWACVLIFVLGCQARSPSRGKDVFTIALPESVTHLDWNSSVDISSSVVETNIMEGLTSLEFSEKNVKVSPALAAKWEISGGGLEYTFTLRDHIKWTDGKPVEAQAFVDSIQRLLLNKSPWAESLFVIKGSRNYFEGKASFSDVGVKAVNEKTLKFTLQEPVKYFLTLFSHHSTFPIRKDLISQNEKDWSDPAHVVTLGAYKISSANSKSLSLEKNDDYVLEGARLHNLNLLLGVSTEEAGELFKTGEIGAALHLSPQDLKGFSNSDELFYTPLFDVTYLTFDVRQKPMSNPIFRRIVGMSLDREDLVHSLKSPVKSDGSMVPPGLVGYESNRGVTFDPDAAQELRRHSGYSSLEKYAPLYLKVNLAAEEAAAAKKVQEQLKKALGVEIKIVMDGEAIPKNAPTIFLSHVSASVPDPDNFLSIFTSMSLVNPTGWKNRNYDDFVKQGAINSSNEAREKLYAKAQHILTETEMPLIPLYINGEFCLINRRVKNFPLNPLDYFPFKNIVLE